MKVNPPTATAVLATLEFIISLIIFQLAKESFSNHSRFSLSLPCMLRNPVVNFIRPPPPPYPGTSIASALNQPPLTQPQNNHTSRNMIDFYNEDSPPLSPLETRIIDLLQTSRRLLLSGGRKDPYVRRTFWNNLHKLSTKQHSKEYFTMSSPIRKTPAQFNKGTNNSMAVTSSKKLVSKKVSSEEWSCRCWLISYLDLS